MAAESLGLRIFGWRALGLIVPRSEEPALALHSNASFLQSARDATSPDAKEALEDVSASCEALGHIIDNVELLALGCAVTGAFEQNSFSVAS